MLSNDANILKIKHEILYQVAKLAYAGQLEEKKDFILSVIEREEVNFNRRSTDVAYTKSVKL